ncbi:MAG TPA: DedA family protein [Candidatus Limnocylindria bacterium]|nr:DedA family protein [Candidatus Limnocylindria bacterium]
MSGILSSLLSYVLVYKYPAIFIITFLGAFALPLPSGSVLMAASAFAVQGYMNWFLVLAVGIGGNMAGDNSGYWLVRKFGLKVIHKMGLGKFFKQDRLEYARKEIERHPIITIYSSRFLTAIAPAVNVVCGFTNFPYRKYLFFEALGEVTECLVFCTIGYIFGSNWEYFNKLTDQFWIVIVAGMLFSYMVWRLILRRGKV